MVKSIKTIVSKVTSPTPKIIKGKKSLDVNVKNDKLKKKGFCTLVMLHEPEVDPHFEVYGLQDLLDDQEI